MSFLVKILTTFCVAAVSGFGMTASAAMNPFKLDRVTVSFDLPSDADKIWESTRDLFGIPLTLLGPEKSGGRPVLTVIPATGADATMDIQNLRSFQSNDVAYRKGRQEWLKRRSGQVVSFIPLKKEVWSAEVKALVMGVRYRLNGVEYLEKSAFVSCKNKLFHLKSLLRAGHEKDYAGTVEKMMRSISCEIF